MCCSFIGQIIYGALMLVALGLTLGAMFSPGWTDLKNTTETAMEDLKNLKIPPKSGIFPLLCQMPENKNASKDNTTSKDNSKDFDYCKDFWKNLPPWEKAVVAMMCLALITELVALAWTLLSIFACCFKQCFVFALPIIALVATIFLAVAVGVFGVHNKSLLEDIKASTNINDVRDDIETSVKNGMQTEVGYSFYLACGALIATAIDIIVGALVKFLAAHCL